MREQESIILTEQKSNVASKQKRDSVREHESMIITEQESIREKEQDNESVRERVRS